ncbi:hypothetical protein AC628_18370 [Bradyrhizobium sp. NAS96.2]|nr:hypothetical protein AC628_18370 [Bradyrhizobium sp. NAS96.2]
MRDAILYAVEERYPDIAALIRATLAAAPSRRAPASRPMPCCASTGWSERCRCCATEASVVTIAAALGYASQTSFAAAFKRLTGDSPTDWRRRTRSQQSLCNGRNGAGAPGHQPR